MDSWNTDKRTDKERFFDGLYSIPKLESEDTLETSAVTLLLATSREQRNTVPSLISRRSRASTATLGVPTVPAVTRSSTMPTPKSEKMIPAAPVGHTNQQPPAPTLLWSSPPPESSRMLSSAAEAGKAGKAGKRKRVTKPAPELRVKKQIFKDLYFCEYALC